jgi:hypothetical protein
VKYLILLLHNSASREMFTSLPPEERAAGLAVYEALTEELVDSGELVMSSPLADESLARRVTVAEGRTSTTDGPFAEVKEHLAGFYLVECKTEARVLEIAARIPEAEFGVVEVRPLMDMSGFEG